MDEVASFAVKAVNVFGWNADWTAAWPFVVILVVLVLPAAWDRFHGR